MKLILISLLVAGCGAPVPVVDTVPSCTTACENQRDLGCELGNTTPDGASCEDVCENSFSAGIPGLAWDVSGLTKQSSCRR